MCLSEYWRGSLEEKAVCDLGNLWGARVVTRPGSAPMIEVMESQGHGLCTTKHVHTQPTPDTSNQQLGPWCHLYPRRSPEDSHEQKTQHRCREHSPGPPAQEPQ